MEYVISAFLVLLCPVLHFLAKCFWAGATVPGLSGRLHSVLHVVTVLIPPVLMFVGLNELLPVKTHTEVSLLVSVIYWGACYLLGGEAGARESRTAMLQAANLPAAWWK
jgi:hypothetical protein